MDNKEKLQECLRMVYNDIRNPKLVEYLEDLNAGYEPLNIKDNVYSELGITKEMLNTRVYNVVLAKRIVYYILRVKYKMPFNRIGKLIGSHHATVIHNVKKYAELIEFDKEYILVHKEITSKYM